MTLLTYAREQIEATIIEARDAIWDLRHPDGVGGLSHALRVLFDRMTKTLGTPATFHVTGITMPLDQNLEHELLMATREALHNAIVHAQSQRIELELRYRADSIGVTVMDDGHGFELELQNSGESRHFGLLGMHERMERIGGYCQVESIRGRGTTILLHLPIDRKKQGVHQGAER